MRETRHLLSRKDDLARTAIVRTPAAVLAPGEVRLAIDRFALTTNNITYAAFGDAIGYWRVFPTDREGWGAMPVWGFATVGESRAEGIAPGERVWGYLPIADELVVQAASVTRHGFVDAAAHRTAVPAVYSRYVRCAADPHYRAELEACQAIYRPLFITSYTAVDFLRANAFFGATRIVVSSASSKTAYGLAWCLRDDGLRLQALTGAGNAAFVAGLGCYDAVVPYAAVEELPADEATLYVDFAGDPALRRRVHERLGTALAYDCLVGSTQTDAFPHDPALPGPPPRFFFAAERLDRHRAEGTIRRFLDRFERDQLAFYARAVDPANPWIEIVEEDGFDAAARVTAALASGRSSPRLGHIVRLPAA